MRWLSVVLPPPWTILLALGMYLFWEGPIGYLELAFGQRLELPQRPGTMTLQFACLAYGLYRALVFHPVLRLGYRRWLASTPWTRAKSLPLGPVHLVVQDLFILCILLGFATIQIDFDPLRVLQWYFLGFLGALSALLWLTGEWIEGYIIAFGVGVSVLMWNTPWASVVTLVLLYSIGYVGLWRSLARFPWPCEQFAGCLRRIHEALLDHEPSNPSWLGWPYDLLRPKWPTRWEFAYHDSILASLLAGWLSFASCSLIADVDERIAVAGTLHFCMLWSAVVIRCAAASNCYRPPISFRGRLATRRWIVPAYDRAFVAPLFSLVIGIGLPATFQFVSPGIRDIFPLFLSAGLLICFNTGPRYKEWCLTAPARLQPMNRNSREMVKVS